MMRGFFDCPTKSLLKHRAENPIQIAPVLGFNSRTK